MIITSKEVFLSTQSGQISITSNLGKHLLSTVICIRRKILTCSRLKRWNLLVSSTAQLVKIRALEVYQILILMMPFADLLELESTLRVTNGLEIPILLTSLIQILNYCSQKELSQWKHNLQWLMVFGLIWMSLLISVQESVIGIVRVFLTLPISTKHNSNSLTPLVEETWLLKLFLLSWFIMEVISIRMFIIFTACLKPMSHLTLWRRNMLNLLSSQEVPLLAQESTLLNGVVIMFQTTNSSRLHYQLKFYSTFSVFLWLVQIFVVLWVTLIQNSVQDGYN